MSTQSARVARFIESFLTLGGSYLGEPFHLLPFQRAILDDVYLTHPDGTRVRRTYLVGLPRKNGKSELAAALALYHLIADTSDAAPQVVSAAGDRQQARIVFDEAARMVKANPDLAKVCSVYRNLIRCHRNGGTYRPVSADAGLQQGLNPSFVVFDELHVFRDSALYDALTLGSATRKSPLTFVISTAGWDLESPLGRLYTYGRKVEAGEVSDPSFGMTWYGPREGEDFDPGDESLWRKWNPAFDAFQNVEEFRSAYRTTHESAFIRYRLNGWTTAQTAWLPAGAWDSVADPGHDALGHKEPVVLGFDGAWKGDSTGLVAVSLEDFHHEVLGAWEAPPGDAHWRTPVRDVEDTIRHALDHFAVREVAADPYRFEQSLLTLAEEGAPVVEFPTNSLARMVPATQAFYDAVMDRGLTHDGDPRLARHVGNAVLKVDARGGRITKDHPTSSRHIDLAVAAVVGHHRAKVWRDDPAPSGGPRMIILDA